MKTSALEVGFNIDANKEVWIKCGAAHITRNPLVNHKQVRREIGDDDDEFNIMILQQNQSLWGTQH